MTDKENNPPPEKDTSKPDASSEEESSLSKEPEIVSSQESLPPALGSSVQSKKEKKSSGPWGVLFFFFLIIAGGIGAGGYFLYQEQMKFQNETFAKLSLLESQLSSLDTEADQARQNKQSLDALSQNFEQFKAELDTTLKSHQSALATLDEDVMRLKEKTETPADTPAPPPSKTEAVDTADKPLPGEIVPETPIRKTPEDTVTEKDDSSHESQKFVEWMENFLAAIWNWISGLFSSKSS